MRKSTSDAVMGAVNKPIKSINFLLYILCRLLSPPCCLAATAANPPPWGYAMLGVSSHENVFYYKTCGYTIIFS